MMQQNRLQDSYQALYSTLPMSVLHAARRSSVIPSTMSFISIRLRMLPSDCGRSCVTIERTLLLIKPDVCPEINSSHPCVSRL